MNKLKVTIDSHNFALVYIITIICILLFYPMISRAEGDSQKSIDPNPVNQSPFHGIYENQEAPKQQRTPYQMTPFPTQKDPLEKSYIVMEQYLARWIGLVLIFWTPILVIITQTALAVRENTINNRKEYSSDDYSMLYWTSTIVFYIAVLGFIAGVILFAMSFGSTTSQ